MKIRKLLLIQYLFNRLMHKLIGIHLILFVFFSCATKKEGLDYTINETKAPIKVMESFIMNDSTFVILLMPKLITLKNNYPREVELNDILMSTEKDGGHNVKKYLIYGFKNTLTPPPKNIYISKNKTFLLYIGYKMFIKNTDKIAMQKDATYTQTENSRKVFDLVNTKQNNLFFKQKINSFNKSYLIFKYHIQKKEGYQKKSILMDY